MSKPVKPPKIDRAVRPIVDALNAIPGISTYSSCGGHAKRTCVSQVEAGTFSVSFGVERTRRGWSALDRLTEAVGEAASPATDLVAWFNGAVDFALTGPHADARAIVAWLRQTREAS